MAAACLIVLAAVPLPSPLFPPDYSTAVLDSEGRVLRVFLNSGDQWSFPPDSSLAVPVKLRRAVLSYEDRHFYRHPGVNPVALVRAFSQNLAEGRVVSGGSTITMQVARLMRPKSRTCFNKLIEMLQAVKLELYFSKEEILSLYLDHAPYGGNIVGYQAASLRYFQKKPDRLTWAEAATLAVLPNAPGMASPTADPSRLKMKRDRLLRKLAKEGAIQPATLCLALMEPVPERSVPFQMCAPHLSRRLFRSAEKASTFRTTLDRECQIRVESLVRRHAFFLQKRGISNAAALVVETPTGRVRAYAGSQDFFDMDHMGQVDGVTAPRSSGSLLKPFLYALCMDEGILLPCTRIRDVPTFYGTFSPANASESYEGLVTAEEALIRSLNVPAVRLLYTYGLHPFFLFLKTAGLSTLFRPPEEYGLPLILGGAEVTLWEMARLYRGLGRGGRFGKLSVLEEMENGAGNESDVDLISPGACYLTLNILRELRRPGSEYYWEQYQNQWPLAWKTGTSYGQRDGWAIGVSPRWTLAVWTGNFGGEGNANLTGAGCAAPLLFDIFNALPRDPDSGWFPEPVSRMVSVSVCRQTGYPAGPHCPETIRVLAPDGMRPMKPCPFHQTRYTTPNGKIEVCSLCWTPDRVKKMPVLVYPPEVVQFMRERGHGLASLPPHNPACPGERKELALQILYPKDGARLYVPRDYGGVFQKVTLRVAHSRREQTLFWYLDNQYLGLSRERHVKAVTLKRGEHCLEVMDERGNTERVRFFVAMKEL
jgi:penicillin-binding protein 1C